jgi:glycosyltransferase involved in cell wall biosynthesis
MRILLTSNASYAPPRGGSTRSNHAWLRQLVARGHHCRVVSASLGEDDERISDGIQIRSVKSLILQPRVIPEEIRTYQPDLVLVSSEDVSHVLLRASARAAPGRIVYLAHTPQFYPFGPESWNPDPDASGIIRSAAGIVVIGRHMAAYVRQHLGVAPAVIHPPIYGEPPFPSFGNFDHRQVLMVNPCEVKGISIFLEIARRFPAFSFAALLGWGTTTADRNALAAVPNIRLLGNVRRIDDVLANTRVLLIPSLWYEGFGLIVMEAMLRSIPVVASDSGGLEEAKQDTGLVVPVRRIEKYLAEFDEVHMPKPVIPEQDLSGWIDALQRLSEDRDFYESESARARTAAERFVMSIDPWQIEGYLLSLKPPAISRRALLARRLRERQKS